MYESGRGSITAMVCGLIRAATCFRKALKYVYIYAVAGSGTYWRLRRDLGAERFISKIYRARFIVLLRAAHLDGPI